MTKLVEMLAARGTPYVLYAEALYAYGVRTVLLAPAALPALRRWRRRHGGGTLAAAAAAEHTTYDIHSLFSYVKI